MAKQAEAMNFPNKEKNSCRALTYGGKLCCKLQKGLSRCCFVYLWGGDVWEHDASQDAGDSTEELAERQDRPPAPAVHHEDAEEVARYLDDDAQAEVGVRTASQ